MEEFKVLSTPLPFSLFRESPSTTNICTGRFLTDSYSQIFASTRQIKHQVHLNADFCLSECGQSDYMPSVRSIYEYGSLYSRQLNFFGLPSLLLQVHYHYKFYLNSRYKLSA
jgi:hypothetical protein